MARKVIDPTTGLMPTPVALITCKDPSGKTNPITLAWVGIVCSEPPMLSISIRPSRYSHKLVVTSGEFVVNVPTAELVRKTDYCGVVSGRDADKMAGAGLTSIPASRVSVSLIKECPINLECVVKHTLRLGTHDMFIAEVVATHVDEDYLDADGKVDVAKLNPFGFFPIPARAEYWGLGKKLGHYGFSKGTP